MNNYRNYSVADIILKLYLLFRLSNESLSSTVILKMKATRLYLLIYSLQIAKNIHHYSKV